LATSVAAPARDCAEFEEVVKQALTVDVSHRELGGSANAGKFANLGNPGNGLVPWKRDDLHKSRSAAPGWQGAKSEHIGHM
jgi:hypothetical protein